MIELLKRVISPNFTLSCLLRLFELNSGPSGCGKTNSLMHMLYQLLFCDKIYLFSKNLQQPKYQQLLKTFQPISKEAGYQVFETSNDEIPSLDELNSRL